jgi:membrane protein DedA with SNARE-associated domain
MSAGQSTAPRGHRWFFNAMRTRRAFQIGGIAMLILLAVIVMAILEGDLPELFHVTGLRPFFRTHGYLAAVGLLYAEESGVPLPAPGDIFVMYVGAHVSRNLVGWLAAWLGLITTVVLGATNLFYISRKFGRRLVESRVAEYVHLTPERMVKAEVWFQKYGVLAIIFGRHIPGFRVPITVAAGILHIRWTVFAASVAISTAIWAGVFLIIGVLYGARFEHFLQVHKQVYLLWGGIIALLFVAHFVRRRINRLRARTLKAQSIKG